MVVPRTVRASPVEIVSPKLAMDTIPAFHYADIPLVTRPGSKYPLHKFGLLVSGATDRFSASELAVAPGPMASRGQIEICHSPEYIEKIYSGSLSEQDERELGFCWSETLYARGATIVGCALAGLDVARETGLAFTLGGGAHHAYADRGRGFCIFNDIAIASLTALSTTSTARVSILDCDVHQGDGTAAILKGDPRVFSCSIHGVKNYPFRKEQSTLDIELEDDCDDSRYLDAVFLALGSAVHEFDPELLIYVAGADPYIEDRLGRLKISKEGLRNRDTAVFRMAFEYEIPTLVVFGGGYCDPIDTTVDLNLQTIEVALEERVRRETINNGSAAD